MGNLSTAIKWRAQGSPVNRQGAERVLYENYSFSIKEEIVCILEGLAITILCAYFFYRSILAVFLLSPIILFYRKEKKRKLAKKRIHRLEMEFREVLLSVNVNLQAGYSMENAFLEAYSDMVNLFGHSSNMVIELLLIRRGMANGITLEQLLWDLGRRCPEGDIKEFTEVFYLAGRTGGRLQEMMKKTIDIIREKAEIKEEIRTLIHARQMESRIMCVIPFFILLYMNLTSPGYFNPLYHNLAGVCIMTVCLFLYGLSVFWIIRITELSL